MGGTIRGLGGVPEQIGGVEDHVHILMSLRTTHAPADIVREIKKASSIWAAENRDPHFEWQEGYSVFTASWNHAEALRGYIAGQDEHHRKLSFKDELKVLLQKNGVKYDAKYLE